MAKIVFNKTGVEEIEFVPVLIENYAQPRILDGLEGEAVLERL